MDIIVQNTYDNLWKSLEIHKYIDRNPLDLLALAGELACDGDFHEADDMIWRARLIGHKYGYPCTKETFIRLCSASQGHLMYSENHADRATPNLLYFIFDKNNNAVKIGVSSNPDIRLRILQIGNPSNLDFLKIIPGDKKMERQWHDRYAHLKLSSEWFRAAHELLSAIEDLP